MFANLVDIGRHDQARFTSEPSRGDCGLFIDVVHMEQSCAVEHLARHLLASQRQCGVALPDDRSFGGPLVHEDDGVTVRRIANR